MSDYESQETIVFKGKVIYLAHPVRGDVEGNIKAAKQIMRAWGNTPDMVLIAPWLTDCELFDDSDPTDRANGLERCKLVLERCDALWLTGRKVSEGMRIERDHAVKNGIPVMDFTLEHWSDVYAKD